MHICKFECEHLRGSDQTSTTPSRSPMRYHGGVRGRGLLLALLFVAVMVGLAWLTGDKSPLADKPAADPKTAE